MKVLIVHSSAGLYGADRCLLSIAEGLVSRDDEAHVALPNEGDLVGELRRVGATVHILDTVVFRRDIFSAKGILRLLKAPASIYRLARLMRREKYDLVHTNTGVTVGGAVAAKIVHIPHIWHFREILSEFGLFLRIHELAVSLLSDRIIFITEAVREQFSRSRIRKMSKVIHDGIPTADFESTLAERENGRIVITTIGLLAPYKGQNVFLAALASAIGQGVDLEAYIVGDVYGDRHHYRKSLESLAKELDLSDRVHFTGFQEDVQPFLEKCNFFVIPSIREEGLGIVILEAMAAGRAVIASNGGGTREIIDDGIDGILVPPADSDRLAEAICRLARNTEERRKLAARGKEKVKEKFSEEAMIASVIDFYHEVLAQYSRTSFKESSLTSKRTGQIDE